MKQYLSLVKDVLSNGIERKNRTGISAYSIFGRQMRFNLMKGFPLVTTKKIHIRSVIYELLWFLKGDTNIDFLKKNNVHIWDNWADSNGNIGHTYGKQWRKWEGDNGKSIDQINNVIHQIKENPTSRRLIVSAWNVADLHRMYLPPCHILFQFYVSQNRLSCHLYQRSADVFIGLPFNIASYALLTHLIAQQCDLEIGELIWTGGDIHIYKNHISQIKLQISRAPFPLPRVILEKRNSISAYQYENIHIKDYQHHPYIKASVAK